MPYFIIKPKKDFNSLEIVEANSVARAIRYSNLIEEEISEILEVTNFTKWIPQTITSWVFAK